jgi:hypothetical protein
MCEALFEQLTEARRQRLGSSFGTRRSAFRALKKWRDEECTRIEAMGRSRDDQGKEIPPLRTLRQSTDA